MAAFNTVRKTMQCPNCMYDVLVNVQFKYGNTWQINYQIGDALRWDGNNVGPLLASKVVVDGVGHILCPKCHYDADCDFYVYVTEKIIVRVDVADGRFTFDDFNYKELP